MLENVFLPCGQSKLSMFKMLKNNGLSERTTGSCVVQCQAEVNSGGSGLNILSISKGGVSTNSLGSL